MVLNYSLGLRPRADLKSRYIEMINPRTGNPYLYVAYPSPDSYFVVSYIWTVENIKVMNGFIYYKDENTSITPYDYLSTGQILGFVDDPDLIVLISNEYNN